MKYKSGFPTEDIISIVGVTLSIVCVIALWTTWYIMPRWRTLHNYTSVNQITLGTIHLIFSFFLIYEAEIFKDLLPANFFILSCGIVFLAAMCWSLSSSLLAYFKLVLLHNGKISNEKVNITFFVYGLTFFIKIITLVVIKIVFDLDVVKAAVLGLYPLCMIIVLMIALFIRVNISVMSCCKKSMSKRKVGHVLAIVGVAVLCDAGTVSWLFMALLSDDDIMNVWFNLRLILQAVFVLFNASSRAHWKWYFSRRRRMRVVV